jgi:hypothetical protein
MDRAMSESDILLGINFDKTATSGEQPVRFFRCSLWPLIEV